MTELTSKQRKQLSSLANTLNPLVIVGGAGVTPSLEEKVAQCFNAHELIKVKFNEFKEQKKELSEALAQKTDSALVRLIGNVAIFYRPSDDEEKRHIILK